MSWKNWDLSIKKSIFFYGEEYKQTKKEEKRIWDKKDEKKKWEEYVQYVKEKLEEKGINKPFQDIYDCVMYYLVEKKKLKGSPRSTSSESERKHPEKPPQQPLTVETITKHVKEGNINSKLVSSDIVTKSLITSVSETNSEMMTEKPQGEVARIEVSVDKNERETKISSPKNEKKVCMSKVPDTRKRNTRTVSSSDNCNINQGIQSNEKIEETVKVEVPINKIEKETKIVSSKNENKVSLSKIPEKRKRNTRSFSSNGNSNFDPEIQINEISEENAKEVVSIEKKGMETKIASSENGKKVIVSKIQETRKRNTRPNSSSDSSNNDHGIQSNEISKEMVKEVVSIEKKERETKIASSKNERKVIVSRKRNTRSNSSSDHDQCIHRPNIDLGTQSNEITKEMVKEVVSVEEKERKTKIASLKNEKKVITNKEPETKKRNTRSISSSNSSNINIGIQSNEINEEMAKVGLSVFAKEGESKTIALSKNEKKVCLSKVPETRKRNTRSISSSDSSNIDLGIQRNEMSEETAKVDVSVEKKERESKIASPKNEKKVCISEISETTKRNTRSISSSNSSNIDHEIQSSENSMNIANNNVPRTEPPKTYKKDKKPSKLERDSKPAIKRRRTSSTELADWQGTENPISVEDKLVVEDVIKPDSTTISAGDRKTECEEADTQNKMVLDESNEIKTDESCKKLKKQVKNKKLSKPIPTSKNTVASRKRICENVFNGSGADKSQKNVSSTIVVKAEVHLPMEVKGAETTLYDNSQTDVKAQIDLLQSLQLEPANKPSTPSSEFANPEFILNQTDDKHIETDFAEAQNPHRKKLDSSKSSLKVEVGNSSQSIASIQPLFHPDYVSANVASTQSSGFVVKAESSFQVKTENIADSEVLKVRAKQGENKNETGKNDLKKRPLTENRKAYLRERKRKYTKKKRWELAMKSRMEVAQPGFIPGGRLYPNVRAGMSSYRPPLGTAPLWHTPTLRFSQPRHPVTTNPQRPLYRTSLPQRTVHIRSTPPRPYWEHLHPAQQNKNLIYVRPTLRTVKVKEEHEEVPESPHSPEESPNLLRGNVSNVPRSPEDSPKPLQGNVSTDSLEYKESPLISDSDPPMSTDYYASEKVEEDVPDPHFPFKKIKIQSPTPQAPPVCSFEDVLPILEFVHGITPVFIPPPDADMSVDAKDKLESSPNAHAVQAASEAELSSSVSEQSTFTAATEAAATAVAPEAEAAPIEETEIAGSEADTLPSFRKTETAVSEADTIPSFESLGAFITRSPPLSPSMVYPDTPRSKQTSDSSLVISLITSEGTETITDKVLKGVEEKLMQKVEEKIQRLEDKVEEKIQRLEDNFTQKLEEKFDEIKKLLLKH